MIRILHRSIAKYPIVYFSSPRNTSAIQGIQLRNDVQPECQKEKKKKTLVNFAAPKTRVCNK